MLQNIRLLAKILVVVVTLITAFLGVVNGKATNNDVPLLNHSVTTPTQCDYDVKYYCAYVVYIARTGSIEVDSRYYAGSIDYGDTRRWRLAYYADYFWDNSCQCYRLDQSLGPSSWFYNGYPLSSYYNYTQNNVLNSNAGLVKAYFQYQRWNGLSFYYSAYFWPASH